jgi:S1-C subfamily serine protease
VDGRAAERYPGTSVAGEAAASGPGDGVCQARTPPRRGGRATPPPYLGIRSERIEAGEGGIAVVPGSPAAAVGLLVGDLITAVDGRPVGGDRTLLSVLGRYAPGATVTLTVDRDGDDETGEVRLDRRPTDAR